MKSTESQTLKIVKNEAVAVPLQTTSLEVALTKYSVPGETGVSQIFDRVAGSLASVEKDPEKWKPIFRKAMEDGAIPAGRILANAGAGEHRDAVSTINCLAGETPVLTSEGVFPIAELVGRKVKCLNGQGRWSEVEFKCYGQQKVYSTLFRYADVHTPFKVRSTANHRWILRNGKVVTTEYWMTGETNSRHTVIDRVCPKFKIDDEAFNRGVVHGCVYGDGSDTTKNYKDVSGYTSSLSLCGDKESLEPLLTPLVGASPYRQTINNQGYQALTYTKIVSDVCLKEVPSTNDPSYILGFIAGILATDGSITKASMNSSQSCYITLYGDDQLANWIERYAPVVGVIPTRVWKNARKGDTTNYGVRSKDLYAISIGVPTLPEQCLLRSQQINDYHVSENASNRGNTWTMLVTESEGVLEEVYCCEEPETNSFCLGFGLLTGNCTVSGEISDSMQSILEANLEAGLTLKSGAGIGYEFSTLRPQGAFVSGAGATTSGPLSFMDIFDKTCFTVSSAGGRRGAQMATFDIRHPDIEKFVTVKREDGRLRQFNLSVLINDEFIQKVNNDEHCELLFPLHERESEEGIEIVEAYWPGHGVTKLKVYDRVPARKIWDAIMRSTYDFAEPGIILIDRINQYNNNWFCEDIRATNPCGEQPLPPHGACLLGSLNLTRFVKNPFSADAYFDMTAFIKTVKVFNRMLDNVVDINGLPLEKQRQEIHRKRRHGIGVIGLGSALVLLGMTYGSSDAVAFTENVMRELCVASYEAGLELAKEKGAAPIMHETFTVDQEMLRRKPRLEGKYKVGDEVQGKDLWVESDFLKQALPKDLLHELKQHGCRYTHAVSIAPTGTISLSVCNNACIAKDTLVSTSKGEIPIQDVDTDTLVRTYIPETDSFEFKEVAFAGLTRANTEVFEIEIEGMDKPLRATYDHKLLVLNVKTGEVDYVQVQDIMADVENYEIVADDLSQTCMICGKTAKSRQSLIKHVANQHKMQSVDYQYLHEKRFNECSTCGTEITLEDASQKFRPGISSMNCSSECSSVAKIHGAEYLMRKYGLTREEADAENLRLYRKANASRLPSQLEYWLKKGVPSEQAERLVSQSQVKTSLKAFVSRYGEEEGYARYSKFVSERALAYQGQGNPAYGRTYTDDQKEEHSRLMKDVMRQQHIVENLVEGITNSDARSAIVGKAELQLCELLDAAGVEYVHQYALRVDSDNDAVYYVCDFYLPSTHTLLEVNEPWHRAESHVERDAKKYQYYRSKGFNVAVVWTDMSIEEQLLNVVGEAA